MSITTYCTLNLTNWTSNGPIPTSGHRIYQADRRHRSQPMLFIIRDPDKQA